MSLLDNLIYFCLHPSRAVYVLGLLYKRRNENIPDMRFLTPSQKVCFHFLAKTGRSYSAVIKSLHPELLLPVTFFYLVLRGLDTIEDDPSIPVETKVTLLKNFKDTIKIEGWAFDENRAEEKDRELLVQFDSIIAEYKALKPAYRAVIKDITAQMGNGMAEYLALPESKPSIQTVIDYNKYCFYVAGLVGQGLTQLFAEAGFVETDLLERRDLQNSMGLLLQKTNIIRDVHEDYIDGRRFWPEEIWSKHVESFEDLIKQEDKYKEAALNCSSEMVLNALEHVEDCLVYLSAPHEESIFTFCAVPQAMALATLELCFRNGEVFQRGLKISKGDAMRIMSEASQGVQGFCGVVGRYTRGIRMKNSSGSKDPLVEEINWICGRIEESVETLLNSERPAGERLEITSKGTAYFVFTFLALLIMIAGVGGTGEDQL